MPSILVVDDEPDTLVVFELLLSLSGYTVRTASSAEEALEALSRGPFDLILTDYMMPRMNGLELCARVRDDARSRATPIILHSAGAVPDGKGKLYDRFLGKPADVDALLALITELLQRSGTDSTPR